MSEKEKPHSHHHIILPNTTLHPNKDLKYTTSQNTFPPNSYFQIRKRIKELKRQYQTIPISQRIRHVIEHSGHGIYIDIASALFSIISVFVYILETYIVFYLFQIKLYYIYLAFRHSM